MAVKLVTEQTKTLTSGRFSDSLAPPSLLTKDTTIGELPAHRYQVGVNTVVAQVEKTLRLYPILPGVIVTQHDRMVNVISRRRFFEILGTRYGVAVFLKRPIEIMIRHAEEPLILPGTCLIDEAVHEALQRETILAYEPILMDFQTHGFQLLDIYTLLLAQSQLFATLQQELQPRRGGGGGGTPATATAVSTCKTGRSTAFSCPIRRPLFRSMVSPTT
ncbi:MAG: hypothetical protein IPJ94_03975 [Chloroflexi bacterium]|nr:hypothetical protein [Chloroflexota bacterium]